MGAIAEGIEEPEQVRMLRRFGCEFGQGFLFSKPLPAEQVGGLFEPAPRLSAL
jgi:EAL domain-containing protein (putative c-di-GMP-specific phosphodiesterase class I)